MRSGTSRHSSAESADAPHRRVAASYRIRSSGSESRAFGGSPASGSFWRNSLSRSGIGGSGGDGVIADERWRPDAVSFALSDCRRTRPTPSPQGAGGTSRVSGRSVHAGPTHSVSNPGVGTVPGAGEGQGLPALREPCEKTYRVPRLTTVYDSGVLGPGRREDQGEAGPAETPSPRDVRRRDRAAHRVAIDDEPLSDESLEHLRRSEEDIRAGRTRRLADIARELDIE